MDNYQITFATWNKIAQLYKDKFMDLDLYNESYDLFCGLIDHPSPDVLEIGSGPGNITRYILSKHPQFRMEGIDVAPNMVQVAREVNPGVHFEVMDCRELNQVTKKYDGVICGFCMPYLSKPDCFKLFADTSALLNPGGVFYFSFIQGNHEQSGFETGSSGDKAFVYYYQEEDLKGALSASHLECIHQLVIDYPKSDGSLQHHLVFICRKASKA